MSDSPSRPIQTNGRNKVAPLPKYLPGQRSLFSEMPSVEIVTEQSATELFYTGKDLPGAGETNQVILWDVA